MKKYVISLSILLTLIISSCSTAHLKVPYVVDAETIPAEVLSQIQPVSDPLIGTNDLLNIEVSGRDMVSVSMFNKGRYITPEGTVVSNQNNTNASGGAEKSTQFYLVDKDGNIDFPIIGKLHVGGKTKSEIAEIVQNAVYPKYVKEKPAVDVRLMNFRVTVIGAVKSPGVIESKTERMNFLEAIAEAGDLDIKGQRENIMLIRTNNNGQREIHRLNLNDKNLLISPYFNLQQNDIIYVQPNESAAHGAWQLNPAVGATITIVGGISSIASFIIGIVNLAK